jgi:predicted amidohydrolase
MMASGEAIFPEPLFSTAFKHMRRLDWRRVKMKKYRVAAVQMCSSTEVEVNLAAISAYVVDAARAGARYVQTPEMSVLFAANKDGLIADAEPFEGNRALEILADVARQNAVNLHVGSVAVALSNGRFANRSVLIDPKGEISAYYDKIHLFDANPDDERSYRESATYCGGDRAVVGSVDGVKLGLSICYDIRFPSLYGALANAGAEIIAVPSAFTVPTGRAHWELLLRARAVETCCFIVAAAQAGSHQNGRLTHGHTMIVGPWGDILAQADGDEPGVVMADLDLDEIDRVRRKVPGLANQRKFEGPRNVEVAQRD